MKENIMLKENKKIIGVCLIAILIALSALSSSTSLSVLILNATNFTVNVSGSPMFSNNVTFIPGADIILTQDAAKRTITITSTAAVTGGVTNESVRPYNVSSLNISGKIPYQQYNASLCNPANQASSFNQATFNFDCVSIADSDPYIPISLQSTYDNYQLAMNAMNTTTQKQSDDLNNTKINKSDGINKTDYNGQFPNDSIANRILNIEINLSNITMITANGSIVVSNLPDGFGNITNVSVSGGLIATYI